MSEDISETVLALQEQEKFKNVGLLIDNNVLNIRLIKNLIDELGSVTKIFPKYFDSFEPTTHLVDETAEHYRQNNIDFFIGIGGGSTIDLTKAVSAMVINPGSVVDYHGTGKPIIHAVRKMMIPTTAGTGSEVTPGAVLVNERTKFKRGLSSPCIAPEFALLCASLTTTLPDHVTASTGMDALGHAIESYTAKNSNTITRMYSREAFRLIFNNLEKVFHDKSNLLLRRNILVGANLAGFAIHNSNTGAGHSLAYPMGIYHKVPHGLAVALVLPEVVRINFEGGCTSYADLYDVIDGCDKKIVDPYEKSGLFCEQLQNYFAMRYLGKGLTDFGINTQNFEALAERGLDLTSALSNNPVDFTLADARNVLKKLISKN
ncbi:MAG: iron-containing alcohol dehydrogenase [Methanoregula sp.]